MAERPGLIQSYDGAVAVKLDRFARSVRYWAHLLDWARDHGKTVRLRRETRVYGMALESAAAF